VQHATQVLLLIDVPSRDEGNLAICMAPGPKAFRWALRHRGILADVATDDGNPHVRTRAPIGPLRILPLVRQRLDGEAIGGLAEHEFKAAHKTPVDPARNGRSFDGAETDTPATGGTMPRRKSSDEVRSLLLLRPVRATVHS
jgi:hypothetical protein